MYAIDASFDGMNKKTPAAVHSMPRTGVKKYPKGGGKSKKRANFNKLLGRRAAVHAVVVRA